MFGPIRDILAKTGLVRDRRQKLLDDLNALDLVGKALRNAPRNRTPVEMLKREHPDRFAEWDAIEPEINFYSLDPTSEEGQSFVAGLDADTLHEFATRLIWDGNVQWFLAIARHPACDHATLWVMYHFAAPEYYEAKAQEAGNNRPELTGTDGEVMELLDVIVSRFRDGDIPSRRFAYYEDFPPGNIRLEQQAARDKGQPLFWELPSNAYADTKGEHHYPAYEVIHGDTAKISFKDWLEGA